MATISAVSDGVWTDNSVWDAGHPPQDGDKVIIEGHDVELNTTAVFGDGTRSTSISESVAQLVIKNNGRLAFSRTVDSYLGVKGLVWVRPGASGQYAIVDMGTDSDPIPDGVTAEWRMNEEKSARYGYYYGAEFRYYNSTTTAEFYAQSGRYRRRNTWLIGAYDAGSTQITVDDATGWKAGDTLILAPRYTSPHNTEANREFETAVIQSVSGNTITLTAGLAYDHGYADEYAYEFAGVSNLTSNVRIMGPDDSHPSYNIEMNRAASIIRNVEFGYANNVYNYHTAAWRAWYGGYYGPAIFEHSATWQKTTGIARHQQGLVYPYVAINNNGHEVSVKDIVIASLGLRSGYYAYATLSAYYGGRSVDYERIYAYGPPAGTGSRQYYGPQCYQQRATFKECKTFGIRYSYILHNNVEAKAKNSASVGAIYGVQGYNGTAVVEDHTFFMVDWLAGLYSQWAAGVDVVRPRYRDGDVYHPRPTNEAAFTVPTTYTYYDMQNDPTKQVTMLAGGLIWRDTAVKATSVASLRIVPDDNYHSPLVIEKSVYVTGGETITVEAQMRKHPNLNTTPRIRMVCSQFDATQDMQDVDNTWVTVSLTSPTLTTGERVTIRFEYDYSSDGQAWLDDVKINGEVWDIGQYLWGKYGTEVSTVIDITDKNRYITLTGLKPGSNVDVYLGTPENSGSATLLDSVHNISGTEWTFGHQHQGEDAYIVIQHLDYVPLTVKLTLPNDRQTKLPVAQQPDRVYSNP